MGEQKAAYERDLATLRRGAESIQEKVNETTKWRQELQHTNEQLAVRTKYI